jgi:hypothetical protein
MILIRHTRHIPGNSQSTLIAKLTHIHRCNGAELRQIANDASAQAICKECARLRKSAAMKGVCYDINMAYMAYS